MGIIVNIIFLHTEKYVFRLVVSDVFGSMWFNVALSIFSWIVPLWNIWPGADLCRYAHLRQMCEWSLTEPKMNCVIAINVIYVVCLSTLNYTYKSFEHINIISFGL